MSFGKKKNSSRQARVQAPPRITNVRFESPTGDVFESVVEGNTQTNRANLSGPTQQLVNSSQRNLNQLTSEFGRSDRERVNQINQRSSRLFDRQSRHINLDANRDLGRVRSDLSKRFGSSQNTTFGNDLISRTEDNRLNRLNDSRLQSDLLAEDQFNADEDRKITRANTFFNYLNGINNQARGASQNGSSILQRETQRSQNLAVNRANALQRFYNQDALRQSRQATLANIIPTFVGTALGTAAGQPQIGFQLGSQLGRAF